MEFVNCCVLLVVVLLTMFISGIFAYFLVWINDMIIHPFSTFEIADDEKWMSLAWTFTSIALGVCLIYILKTNGLI